MNTPTPLLTGLLSLVALGATASAQYTIDYSGTTSPSSLGGRGAGQSFTPADVAGYGGEPTLALVELKFWSGNLGGPGHATSYIAVYDGDPDTATLVGSSTNSVDTSAAAALPNYTELTWTFNNLQLQATTMYWCVLSNSPMDVNPTNTVERSLQTWGADVYTGGHSIIADRAPHGSGRDLRFLATFRDPNPTIAIDFGNTTNPGSLGGRGAGQTFVPADAAGYNGSATLQLRELSFWSGNLGGTGSPTTYIAVYDGDPDTATFLGSSINFIDTSAAAAVPNYTEWTWSFNNLQLSATTEYWCVMSSALVDMNPATTVERSLQTWSADSYAGGTSVIADRERHSQGYDLRFVARFNDPSATLGTGYCAAAANSTGVPAVLRAAGSAAVAANDVTLTASDMPAGSFGFFLTSTVQGFVANPGGSQGNLCLGGAIGRYVGPGQIQNSGTVGSISLQLDLTQTPTPTGLVAVAPGQTWNFQAWYRDVVTGSATSNFTSGLEIPFQ